MVKDDGEGRSLSIRISHRYIICMYTALLPGLIDSVTASNVL